MALLLLGVTVESSAAPDVTLIPRNPSPAHEGTYDPSQQSYFTWETESVGGVTYDVLFGETGQMAPVALGLTEPRWAPPALEAHHQYQWQVIVHRGADSVPGPLWVFTCVQWIRYNADSGGVNFRILSPGTYAGRVCTVRVASNDLVGLLFGSEIDDLVAGADRARTWYAWGPSLEQAVQSSGWRPARDLRGVLLPGLFPAAEEGTDLQLWVRIETTQATRLDTLANRFSLTLLGSDYALGSQRP